MRMLDTIAWEQGLKQLEEALSQKEEALYHAEVERDKAVAAKAAGR